MVQAYSIGTGKRSTDNPPLQGPGPGAYNPEKKQKQVPPAYKMPQSMRASFDPNKTPGPGTYGPSSNPQIGPKFSFAGKKQQQVDAFQPGPGAYNPQPIKQAPLYSFGGKYNSTWQDGTQPPGPGTYNTNGTLDAPSSKFGKSQRGFHVSDAVPGPGNYNPKFRPDSAPRYKIGTSRRRDLYDSEVCKVPGPGTYDQQSAFEPSQAKGYTLISRREVPSHELSVPGPGAYNPQAIKRPPSCRIGKSARSQMGSGQTPGPGEYEPQLEVIRPQSAQVRVGSAKRRPLNECVGNPGPGTYEITSRAVEGPKVSILGHKYDPIQSQKDQVPGPGQYEKPLIYRPQSAKIGTARRSDLHNTQEVPGPGQYKPPQRKDGPSWGFGSSNRPPLNPKNDTPGPGGYDPTGGIGNVPVYAQKGINNK